MSTVEMHDVVSVDGFIADENDDVGPLFDWYDNGETPLTDSGEGAVSQASAEYVRPLWTAIGTMVIGRHVFDMMNGWDRASGTSGRSTRSICSRTPTQ